MCNCPDVLSWCMLLMSAASQEADSQLMYRCLRVLFERAPVFGGSLFSLAANVMGDIIHQDPLCYRALDEAGLPEAFINSVKVRKLSHV